MMKIYGIVIITALVFTAAGCGRQAAEKTEDRAVVARINGYELTVEDFKDEADLSLVRRYGKADPMKAKEELLEDIIIKKVLIQEAQKENFDKDRAFMKEIEKYWEQALLKLLLKKKEGELSSRIKKSSPRIREEELMEKTASALDEWVSELRKNSSVKVDKEVLRKVEY